MSPICKKYTSTIRVTKIYLNITVKVQAKLYKAVFYSTV